jgi:hypothetical protein
MRPPVTVRRITKSVVRDALEELFDTLQVAQAVTADNGFFLAMIRKESSSERRRFQRDHMSLFCVAEKG